MDITNIPPELWIQIFKLGLVEPKDLIRLSGTCRYLYDITHNYEKYIHYKCGKYINNSEPSLIYYNRKKK